MNSATSRGRRTDMPPKPPQDYKSQLAKRQRLISTLETYCRGYAAGVRDRIWDPTSPIWSSMSAIFRADPEIGILPQPQTLSEFLESRRILVEEYPHYAVKVLEVSTEVDESTGRAECFLSLEVSGVPEGVVRQSLGILEFLRADMLPLREERWDRWDVGGEEKWRCVRYRNLRGLGGEIMVSGTSQAD